MELRLEFVGDWRIRVFLLGGFFLFVFFCDGFLVFFLSFEVGSFWDRDLIGFLFIFILEFLVVFFFELVKFLVNMRNSLCLWFFLLLLEWSLGSFEFRDEVYDSEVLDFINLVFFSFLRMLRTFVEGDFEGFLLVVLIR